MKVSVNTKSRLNQTYRSLNGLLVLIVALAVGACAASAPPPPPPSGAIPSSTSSAKKKIPDDDEEATVEKETTSTETPAAAFLGADVGDTETKKAASDCIKTKKFFDRAGAAPGKCSTLKLADIECTVDGIKGTFTTDTDKKAFADMLARDTYSGFLADQCIDCKGSSDDLCKKDGVAINGMKILFVKEDTDVIKLQYMIKQ